MSRKQFIFNLLPRTASQADNFANRFQQSATAQLTKGPIQSMNLRALILIGIRWEFFQVNLLIDDSLRKASEEEIMVVFVSDHCQAIKEYKYCVLYATQKFGGAIPLDAILSELTHLKSEAIVVKNYIEPGNVLITSSHMSIKTKFIAQLGDTHHVPGALELADRFLATNYHEVLFSLSNPMHGCLFGHRVRRAYALPPYLIENVKFKNPRGSAAEISALDIGFCISLTSHQYNRTACAKKILFSKHLARIRMYNHIGPRIRYFELLGSLSASIIPSLSGQLSPQILFALSQGVVPVVDTKMIRSLYCEHLVSANNGCLSIESFLSYDQTQLDEALLSKGGAILKWQAMTKSFIREVRSEYNMLLLAIDDIWINENCMCFDALTPREATIAIKAVSDIFQYCKSFNSLIASIDRSTSMLTLSCQKTIVECILQIPHMEIEWHHSFGHEKQQDKNIVAEIASGIILKEGS